MPADSVKIPTEPPPRTGLDPLRAVAEAACAGDRRAARELLSAVGPLVLRTARVMLGASNPDVEDVVQESLAGLMQSLRSFRFDCTVLHFATRIAVHRASAWRRGVRRAPNAVERNTDTLSSDESPSKEVRLDVRRRLVRELLDTLPESQAEALTMHVMLGYSVDEVAEATGVPLNTVRSRLRLAKDALRERIERHPYLAGSLGGEA